MSEQSDDLRDQYEQCRLHDAARSGDIAECTRLLNEGHQLNAFDDSGNTPLHYAAESQNLEVMKLLIDSGASVNAHDERVIGNTPLGEVAGNCTFAVAKLLIDSGADPTSRKVVRRHRTIWRDYFNQITHNELIYYVTHPDAREERLVHQFPMRYLFKFEAEHLLARCGFDLEAVYADYDQSPYGSKIPGGVDYCCEDRLTKTIKPGQP